MKGRVISEFIYSADNEAAGIDGHWRNQIKGHYGIFHTAHAPRENSIRRLIIAGPIHFGVFEYDYAVERILLYVGQRRARAIEPYGDLSERRRIGRRCELVDPAESRRPAPVFGRPCCATRASVIDSQLRKLACRNNVLRRGRLRDRGQRVRGGKQ